MKHEAIETLGYKAYDCDWTQCECCNHSLFHAFRENLKCAMCDKTYSEQQKNPTMCPEWQKLMPYQITKHLTNKNTKEIIVKWNEKHKTWNVLENKKIIAESKNLSITKPKFVKENNQIHIKAKPENTTLNAPPHIKTHPRLLPPQNIDGIIPTDTNVCVLTNLQQIRLSKD